MPVFRWARGQKLSQNLLSLQLPLYEQIMDMAPDSFHTLVVSGDVYIRTTEPLQNAPIPEADVVCYGLWVDPSLASHHGVFLSRRESPETLDYMLQKPSKEILSSLAASHFFLMDIGVWLLSDRAVRLLADRSRGENGELHAYDLYGEFGLALGANPQIRDEELNSLSVAVGEEADTIEDVYEPYLIQEGYMMRTPQGRIVSEKSWQLFGLKPPSHQNIRRGGLRRYHDDQPDLL